TVTAATARRAKAAGQRFGQYRFWVFGREGKACPTCATPVERLTVGSRNLFLCPVCQPAAKHSGT
ncbi:MAG: zinc finger domain-containing protein, partial [Pseudomonadota bacterium]